MKPPFTRDEYNALLRSIGREPLQDPKPGVMLFGGTTSVPCQCGALLSMAGGGKDLLLSCASCGWYSRYRLHK